MVMKIEKFDPAYTLNRDVEIANRREPWADGLNGDSITGSVSLMIYLLFCVMAHKVLQVV
jgi:hypothetical protein